jgi:hypothetical protein
MAGWVLARLPRRWVLAGWVLAKLTGLPVLAWLRAVLTGLRTELAGLRAVVLLLRIRRRLRKRPRRRIELRGRLLVLRVLGGRVRGRMPSWLLAARRLPGLFAGWLLLPGRRLRGLFLACRLLILALGLLRLRRVGSLRSAHRVSVLSVLVAVLALVAGCNPSPTTMQLA